MLGVMARACDPSSWTVEARGLDQGQLHPHSEFGVILGYIVNEFEARVVYILSPHSQGYMLRPCPKTHQTKAPRVPILEPG